MATNMKKQGLYNPDNEHDSCGIGFVANLKNVKSHHIVQQGLKILCKFLFWWIWEYFCGFGWIDEPLTNP